jgi:hypothetical protein
MSSCCSLSGSAIRVSVPTFAYERRPLANAARISGSSASRLPIRSCSRACRGNSAQRHAKPGRERRPAAAPVRAPLALGRERQQPRQAGIDVRRLRRQLRLELAETEACEVFLHGRARVCFANEHVFVR